MCIPAPYDPRPSNSMFDFSHGTLGGCRICALNGTACESCWEGYGLASNGTCVKVSLPPASARRQAHLMPPTADAVA